MNTPYCANEGALRPVLPAWLAGTTGDLQYLYAYWLACRGSRPMPQFADLDLIELAAGFHGLLLARAAPEASPIGFLFHPLAHLAVEGGESAAGLDPSLFKHIPLDGCNLATIRRAPVVDRVSQLSADGMLVDCEVIYLPLGTDGGRDGALVAAILILAVETLPSDFLA